MTNSLLGESVQELLKNLDVVNIFPKLGQIFVKTKHENKNHEKPGCDILTESKRWF